MFVFCSPLKLVQLLKNRATILENAAEPDTAWFFTEQGKNAYRKAATPADKTFYFYRYLCALAQPQEEKQRKRSNREALFRLAFIMADEMDESSLSCAGYPAVLDENKNPFLRLVKELLFDGEFSKYSLILLSSLRAYAASESSVISVGVALKDAAMYLKTEDRPYLLLTHDEKSDFFKIERDIIAAFHDAESDLYAPYIYDINESQLVKE